MGWPPTERATGMALAIDAISLIVPSKKIGACGKLNLFWGKQYYKGCGYTSFTIRQGMTS